MTHRPRNLRFVILACAALSAGQCTTSAPTGLLPREYKGAKAFIDATSQLGDAAISHGWGGLALFDYDNDGDLDMYITSDAAYTKTFLRNDGQGNFSDVTQQVGLELTDDNCFACGVGDLNNDGWLDLLVARQNYGLQAGRPVGALMFLNNGPDANGVVSFRQVTPEESGFDSQVPSMGFGVGDLDNDGLLDIVVTQHDLTEFLSIIVAPYYGSLGNEVWRCTGISNGIPQYQRMNVAEGVAQQGLPEDTQDVTFIPGSFVAHLTDVDADGRLDILYLHDIPGGIDYYHNDGNFEFSLRQRDTLNQHGGWMGIAEGDFDGDGDIDYFVTNTGCDFYQLRPDGTLAHTQTLPNGTSFHKLLRNDDGTLVDIAAQTQVTSSSALPPANSFGGTGLQATEFGFGATWIDSDNRGSLDLYWTGDLISYLQPGLVLSAHGVGRFLENKDDGSFDDQTAERGVFDIQADRAVAFDNQDAGRAAVAADVNGDGFQDLMVTNSTISGNVDPKHRLFLNPGVPGNHWLTVRLQGTLSNRFGIGARIIASVGGKTRAAEVVSSTSAFCGVQPEAHFGMGSQTSVETLTVHWPSGQVSVLNDVQADQVLVVSEPGP